MSKNSSSWEESDDPRESSNIFSDLESISTSTIQDKAFRLNNSQASPISRNDSFNDERRRRRARVVQQTQYNNKHNGRSSTNSSIASPMPANTRVVVHNDAIHIRSDSTASPTNSPVRPSRIHMRRRDRPWGSAPKTLNSHPIPNITVKTSATKQVSNKDTVAGTGAGATNNSKPPMARPQTRPKSSSPLTREASSPKYSAPWFPSFTNFTGMNPFSSSPNDSFTAAPDDEIHASINLFTKFETIQKEQDAASASVAAKYPIATEDRSYSTTKSNTNYRQQKPNKTSKNNNQIEENDPFQESMQRSQDKFAKSRSLSKSKSPPKPSPNISSSNLSLKNSSSIEENNLHNILSCASSPSDPKWLQALELLTTSPNPRKLAMRKITNASNWTALHIVTLSNPPLFILYALLLVYPEAVKERDSGGRLPLHLAAGSEANVCILSALVRFHSESIVAKEGRGLIPLHLALLRGGTQAISVELLRVLLGQRLATTSTPMRKQDAKRVRDGLMRKGQEHLKLGPGEIGRGTFGENQNSLTEKEHKRRERESRLQDELNGIHIVEDLSRGFGGNSTLSPDSQHDFLSSLWEEHGSPGLVGSTSKLKMFGTAEIEESQTFTREIKDCLKQLSKWRKKRGGKGGIDATFSEESEETNGLLNPAGIRAAPHMRLPIHMAIRRNHQNEEDESNESTPNTLSSSSPLSNLNEILRILIHAHPPSLMVQDLQGRTPLMTALQLAHQPAKHPIDLETIELLLGIRTAGFQIAPEWLSDFDVVSSNQRRGNRSEKYNSDFENGSNHMPTTRPFNPAMIPTDFALPLHIAAQEALSPSIVHAIFTSYPGAKYVQDARKSAPLHCLLRNIAGSAVLDLEIVHLLMDGRVARMKDDLNQSVLDLLVLNAKKRRLPLNVNRNMYQNREGSKPMDSIIQKSKRTWHSVYQNMFRHCLYDDSFSSGMQNDDKFLQKIRTLPAWLRWQACATPAIQRLLLRQLTKMEFFASIMFYGVVLVTLIIIFIFMVDDAVFESFNIVGKYEVHSSYRIVIILATSYLALNDLAIFIMAFRLRVASNQCIRNVWTWISVGGLITAIATTERLNDLQGGNNVDLEMNNYIDDPTMFTLSTVAIGFLWTMLIGYISKWWYRANVFCSGILRIAQGLLSTLLIFGIIVVSFLQMFYLVERRAFGLDSRCNSDINNEDGIPICSVWNTFHMTYLLIIGESLFPPNGEFGGSIRSSTAVVLIVSIFSTITFLILLHMVSSSIEEAKRKKMKSMTVDMFWSPMLTFIFLQQDMWNLICCCCKDKSNSSDTVQRMDCFLSFEMKLERRWEFLCASFLNGDLKDTKWWYLQERRSKLFANKWIIRSLALVTMPIWFSLGLVTLGILWPPQVRWWIFSISFPLDDDDDFGEVQNDSSVSAEGDASGVRLEVLRLKAMMIDRFHDLQDDLQNIQDSLVE